MWHHEACRVMTNGDHEAQIFYPTLTRIMDFFLLLTTVFIYFIYFFKKKLPEVPEYAKMQFHMIGLLDVLGRIAWVR